MQYPIGRFRHRNCGPGHLLGWHFQHSVREKLTVISSIDRDDDCWHTDWRRVGEEERAVKFGWLHIQIGDKDVEWKVANINPEIKSARSSFQILLPWGLFITLSLKSGQRLVNNNHIYSVFRIPGVVHFDTLPHFQLQLRTVEPTGNREPTAVDRNCRKLWTYNRFASDCCISTSEYLIV